MLCAKKNLGNFQCVCVCVRACVRVCTLSHIQLFVTPALCDCSPPGFSVHGILQARIMEWAAISSSKGNFQPRGRTCVSYTSCIG